MPVNIQTQAKFLLFVRKKIGKAKEKTKPKQTQILFSYVVV